MTRFAVGYSYFDGAAALAEYSSARLGSAPCSEGSSRTRYTLPSSARRPV